MEDTRSKVISFAIIIWLECVRSWKPVKNRHFFHILWTAVFPFGRWFVHLYADLSALRTQLTWVASNETSFNRRLSWTLSAWWTQSSVTAYYWQMFSCASGSLNMRQYSRFTQITLVLCHPQLATNPSLPWQHKWCSCPNFVSHLQTQSIPTASMPLAHFELWEFHLPFSPTICFTWSVTADWNPTTIFKHKMQPKSKHISPTDILEDKPTLSDLHKA